MFRALIHASEVLTGCGVRRKDGRRVEEADLGRIEDGAVVARCSTGKEPQGKKGRAGKRDVFLDFGLRDRIEWVGPTSELPKKFLRAPRRSLAQKQAVIPGLVDCHTHLVFAGDRSEEFADRCAGATYEKIARRGGGILSTVRATREASVAELERLAVARVREVRAFGVRALEIKSGYGLSFESEIKILRVIERLKKHFPDMIFQSTFLGAHAFPKDVAREAYLDELLNHLLPEVARRKLADACDVFIDAGYFTIEEGSCLLGRAQQLGLKTKVHADELTDTGAAGLAAEGGALSADHLLKISSNNIEKLANSNTVAVLLPGTAFYLKAAHAPARALLDAGAAVALATDFNPGTCMTLSLPAIMTIAALYLGMSRAEIFAAVTYNGAKALGLEGSIGSLEPGKHAVLSVLPFPKFEEMYYRFAWSAASR